MVAAVHTSIPRATRYRFADLTLDLGQRRVARNGQALHLGKLTYEMLVAIVQAAPNVVTQDELVERVWVGRVATPETVAQRVKLLRLALGDRPNDPRYVEVLRGHGYRLIPPVEREAEAHSPALAEIALEPSQAPPQIGQPAGMEVCCPPETRPTRHARLSFVIPATVAVAAAVAITWYVRDREPAAAPPANRPAVALAARSIAVLPFADMSADQDQQYFSDGLTEEILNLLAQSPELRVIARTSSFSFRGENVDIATVARKLNVSHVLEGSVRKTGNRVRITAQFVDATNSLHLWSRTYDRELTDIFAVQSDIAASVAGAMRVALNDNAVSDIATNPKAYEHALRAHFFFQRRSPGDLERARMYYRQALDLDPDFARAWAGLAGVYWIQTAEGDLPRDAGLAKLREAAERALALDAKLTEAHLRMAIYLWTTGERREAREHFERAAALEPNNPLLLSMSAGYESGEGRLDKAIELQRRAVAIDPLWVIGHMNLASILVLAGRLDEAKLESLKVSELDPSRPAEAAALAFILEGDFDNALRLVEAAPESVERAACMAMIYHGLGRQTEADAALAKLVATYPSKDPDRIAEVYAYRGEREAAFEWLQKIAAMEPFRRDGHLIRSPFLKTLHTDPRWEAWVESVR